MFSCFVLNLVEIYALKVLGLCRSVEGGIGGIVCNTCEEVNVRGEIGEVLDDRDVGSRHLRDLLLWNDDHEVRIRQIIRILIKGNEHNTLNRSAVGIQRRSQLFAGSNHTHNRHLAKGRSS